jgi:ABC-type multidrug transport system ATPase subunit
MIDRVGLDPKRLAGVETRFLSTGMRQRLKLAFATLSEPTVLFLDEPSSNLDEAGRAIVQRVVAEQRRGGAVVIASNDTRDLALADEVMSL